MKKLFSLMASLALLVTLSACGEKECEPEVVTKEVIKEVPREVIKEVPVEVKVEVEVPMDVERVRQYKPGTYFDMTAPDENGVVTFVFLVVDNYGRLINVHLDNTTTANKYKYDDELDRLYVYVEGVEDVIPNTYRYIDITKDEWKIPTVNDSITVDDLIEGYPWFDAKIATLTDVMVNETQQVIDYNAADRMKTWSYQMDLVADEIVKQQTTYGINLYVSGDMKLTNTVKGVSVDISKELGLVQKVLDNDAKLTDSSVLLAKEDKVMGIYKPNEAKFIVEKPRIAPTGVGVIYNMALVVTDEYGKLAGVVVDSTYSRNGVSTTKWVLNDQYGMKNASPIGKDWFEQAKAIADATIVNQGTSAFKFVSNDAEMKPLSVAKVFEQEKDGTFKNLAKLDNVAGATLQANELVEPLFEAVDSLVATNLVPGVYSGSLNDSKVTIIVENDATGTPVIKAVNLDTLYKQDQAYIRIKDVDYELYSYEKGSVDLSLEEVRTTTYIYKDGSEYRYALDEGIDKGYEVGDRVNFDYAGYDEEATIKPVLALSTKKALGDRYGMATAEGELEWYEQADAYERRVVSKGLTSFNMLEDKTDSVAGLTMSIGEYNALLQKVLLSADDAENIDKSYVKTSLADLGLATYKIAKGNYVATSDLPTKDGGLYLLNMIVLDDGIVYLQIDETIEVDGKLTTKNTLANDYKVEYKNDELIKVTDKDAETYASFMAKKLSSATINLAKALAKGYDYKLDDELEYAKDETSVCDDELISAYNNAFEKVLLSGLQGRVKETMDEVSALVEKEVKDKYVVASDDVVNGQVTLNIPKTSLVVNGREEIEFEINTDNRDVDIKDDDNAWYIMAEAEDFMSGDKVKFTYTMEFDDYEVVSKEFTLPIMSNHEYKEKILNDKVSGKDVNAHLTESYNGLLTGEVVELSLATSLGTDKLGNEAASNNNLMFKVIDLQDVRAYYPTVNFNSTSPLTFTLAYKDGKLVHNAADVDLTATTEYTARNYTIKTIGAVTIATDADVLDINSWKDINGKLPTYKLAGSSEEKTIDAKVLADIFEVQTGDIVDSGEALVVVTNKASEDENKGNVIGKFTVKGFFDNYDQDEKDGKGTWQKGEASRDFSFDIYSKEAALKHAKAVTGLGKVKNEVSTDYSVVLSSGKDIKIQGVDITWSATGKGVSIVDVDGAKQASFTTASTSQRANLTAKYSGLDGLDNTRTFEILIKPTSSFKVVDKVKKAVEDTLVIPRYIDINALGTDATASKYLNVLGQDVVDVVSSLGGSEVEYRFSNAKGKTLDIYQSLGNVVGKEVNELQAGETKDVQIKFELSFTYDEKEIKVEQDILTTVFSNSDSKYAGSVVTINASGLTEDKLLEAINNAKTNGASEIIIKDYNGSTTSTTMTFRLIPVVKAATTYDFSGLDIVFANGKDLKLELPGANVKLTGTFTGSLDISVKTTSGEQKGSVEFMLVDTKEVAEVNIVSNTIITDEKSKITEGSLKPTAAEDSVKVEIKGTFKPELIHQDQVNNVKPSDEVKGVIVKDLAAYNDILSKGENDNQYNGKDIYLTIDNQKFGEGEFKIETNTQNWANPPKLHLTVKNSTFTGNTAGDNSNPSFMYLPNVQELVLEGNTFDSGTGLKYGINWNLCQITDSTILIKNNTFIGEYSKNVVKLNARLGADDKPNDITFHKASSIKSALVEGNDFTGVILKDADHQKASTYHFGMGSQGKNTGGAASPSTGAFTINFKGNKGDIIVHRAYLDPSSDSQFTLETITSGTTKVLDGTKDNTIYFDTIEDYNAAVKAQLASGEDKKGVKLGSFTNVYEGKDIYITIENQTFTEDKQFKLENTQGMRMAPSLHLTIKNSTFTGNTAGDQTNPSFMYLPNCKELVIEGCTFDSGKTPLKYGINWNLCGVKDAEVILKNNTFKGDYLKNVVKMNQRNGIDDHANDVKVKNGEWNKILEQTLDPFIETYSATIKSVLVEGNDFSAVTLNKKVGDQTTAKFHFEIGSKDKNIDIEENPICAPSTGAFPVTFKNNKGDIVVSKSYQEGYPLVTVKANTTETIDGRDNYQPLLVQIDAYKADGTKVDKFIVKNLKDQRKLSAPIYAEKIDGKYVLEKGTEYVVGTIIDNKFYIYPFTAESEIVKAEVVAQED